MSAAANVADRDELPLRLAPGVRLHQDRVRGRWVLLGPEVVATPSATGLAVLRLVDGRRSLAEVVDALEARYEAPRAAIEADVVALLGELGDAGLVDGAPR